MLSQQQKFAIRNSKPVLFQSSLSRSYTNSTFPPPSPQDSTSSSYLNKFAKAIAKRLPTVIIGKLVVASVIGLISVDLLYAGYRNWHNEHFLNKTVEKGTRPKINVPEDELVHRPDIVERLKEILQPHENYPFYHVVCGESGTGKTTLTRIASGEVGGVIYVEFPSDPKDKNIERFGEAFGESLNFKFEEHISFMAQLKKKILGDNHKADIHPKWRRALEAFRKAGAVYKAKHNRLPVIVYDNINGLMNVDPEVLDSLQEDAKMSVDHREYVAVFISSEGSVPGRMMLRSAWSRVKKPVMEIGDLSEKEAKAFLIKKCTIEKRRNNVKKECEEESKVYLIKRCNKEIVKKECIINDEQVNELYKLVGGRILALNEVAENFLNGISLEAIKQQVLTEVEKKFQSAQLLRKQLYHEAGKKAINALLDSKEKELGFTTFMELFNSYEEASKVLKFNIFAYHPEKNTVSFQSQSVESYIQEKADIFK
ncbi:P-loop containing nucleoside triphosphate hydrolase protein [Rhizophagus clarus]|nr:P-loop containing nucleoside triphosphate hydrolase protein [Rhizophagus clarus]